MLRTVRKKTPLQGRRESPQAAIGQLFKNMHQSMRQAVEESLRRERIDLSFAHFITLNTLASEPGVAGAALARRGFVTAQTMNAILHRLESDGAIERHPHPTNQRADSWHITKAGDARLARAQVVAERVWARMFVGLKDQEVKQLQKYMERCLAGLERQLGEMRQSRSARATPAKKTRANGRVGVTRRSR